MIGARESARRTRRIGYVLYPEFGTAALVVVFGKNEKVDLSPADRRAVAVAVESFRDELRDASRRDQ